MQTNSIFHTNAKYKYIISGRGSGRAHASIVVFKTLLLKYPKTKMATCSLAFVDFAISQGIKPSQIIWTGGNPFAAWKGETWQSILDQPWRQVNGQHR